MIDVVNASPTVVAYAWLLAAGPLAILVVVVLWLGLATIKAPDRDGLAACLRAIADIVRAFRRAP